MTPWWKGALLRWQNSAIDPGDFLTAVLCNDLFGAYGRADEFSKADMDLIVKFVYNNLPRACWGDRERMKVWEGLSLAGTAAELNSEPEKGICSAENVTDPLG